MNIILRSNTLVVKDVIKKTSAKMFKDLNIGDKIELSVPVKYAGHNRGTTYSTYIRTINLNTGESVLNSFNQLPKLLGCFELQEMV